MESPLAQLETKTLVMLVGPTAIGKSTLMNEVIRLDNRFKRVSGFTTREKRANDEPGMYRYVTDQQAADIIESHQQVQYIRHTTTGKLYGTQLIDYPGQYNLQDTITTAVNDYRSLPFKQTITVSLTTDPAAWKLWLEKRFPTASDDRTKRLHEAKQSIEWSLAQTKLHYWLVNDPNDISKTANELIRLCTNLPANSIVPAEAPLLHQAVQDLL